LRRTVLETIRRALEGDEVGAMIDFPNYGNVGDSAIYLGQLAALRAVNRLVPRFICDLKTYDREALKQRAGTGTILLTGGGNFGDLWPEVQRVREDILEHFPGNRVIQLPQTINFQSAEALERARAVVRGHPDFTLLVRDRPSLAVAREHFGPRSYLCPDMAFCLNGLRPVGRPDRDIVWLARTDSEKRDPGNEAAQPTADWIDDTPGTLLHVNRSLSRGLRRTSGPLHRWALRATYTPLARQRLRRGIRLVSRGRVVVTDRLHGHVLCLLLGIPHVVLDDRFGKISNFRAVWTREADGVEWARSPDEAMGIARALVNR
jgi:pyruvyl transferase EpsO